MPEPIDPVAFHDFEHAGWQKASTFYADTFGTLTATTIDALLESVRVKPGMRILDVASGPGFAAGAAAARGVTVVGVDFSPLMVEEARRRYESVASLEFLEGDAQRLPFEL